MAISLQNASVIFQTFFCIFLQNELKEVEEKFRQAMVANAGLDNEKSSLTYQVRLSMICTAWLDCSIEQNKPFVLSHYCQILKDDL